MKIEIRHIVILFLLIIPTGLLKAENELPQGAEEGLFTLKYSYFSLDITTIMYQDSVYIPCSDFFGLLKIYYEVPERNIINGFVFNQDSSFSINTRTKVVHDITNKSIEIKESDFIITNLETYLLPSILEKIFHLSIYVKPKQLKIHITSDYKFPILLEEERLNKYSRIGNTNGNQQVELPLLYNKNWTFFDGGMIDYNLSGAQTGYRQRYGFGGNLGFQLLGGEMQYNINSNYDVDSRIFNKNENYRWRYNFTENKYISQIAVGSIYNVQSRGSSILNLQTNNRNLNGIQFSNESIKMPSAFSTFLIQDKIQPNWQVELYVADQLFAQTVSDNLGYYQFELPINYGNTNIEVKIYGPHGEFISNRDVISIPSEILTPGEVKYNVGAGQDVQTKKYYGNGLLTTGVTDWFANSIYFEKEYDAFGYTFVDNSSIRLMNSILLNTSISPDKFYKAGIRVLFEKMGAYDFIYSMNNPNELTRNTNHSIMISGGIPRLFDLPINISFRGAHTESNQISTSTVNASLSLNFDKFYISTRYYISYNRDKNSFSDNLNQNVNFQIDYSWYKKPSFLNFLGNTRFSINSGYIFNSNQFTSVGLTISQEIAKIANLVFSNQYNTSNSMMSSNLTIMLNTSLFRLNSSLQSSPEYESSYSQNLTGSINYDSERGKLFFSNSGSFNSSSSGGASVRFYIDKNENGYYDDEDHIVEDGVIYIPGATIEKDIKGIKRVLNLLPGGRYNLYVKPGSFKNPNMIPKISEFSFIAEPNTMRSIDIPCIIAGVIEGSVAKLDTNNKKEGQAGVKIHIISKSNPDFHQTVPVFSDGTYYKNGLIPDSYILFIDSIQLNLLNSKCEPEFIEFSIISSNDGDYRGDLDFIISDNDSIINIKKENQLKIARKEAEDLAIKNRIVKQENQASISKTKLKSDPTNLDTMDLKTLESIKLQEEFKGENIVTEAKDLTKDSIIIPDEIDPIKPGTLSSLMFAKSRITYLSISMKKYLDRVAEYMIANPRSILKIDGHSDNFGTLEDNFKVSNKRAKEVFNYMVLKGIDKYRLRYAAHGPLQPRGDYKTAKGRAQNMRVELNLILNN